MVVIFKFHLIFQVIILFVVTKDLDVVEHVDACAENKVEWARDHPHQHEVKTLDARDLKGVYELSQVNVGYEKEFVDQLHSDEY